MHEGVTPPSGEPERGIWYAVAYIEGVASFSWRQPIDARPLAGHFIRDPRRRAWRVTAVRTRDRLITCQPLTEPWDAG